MKIFSQERDKKESELKALLAVNDKELDSILRKRKAIVADIKASAAALKRRRKELVSNMGALCSNFKTQASNIVQEASARQEKREQKMRSIRRKSVSHALSLLANHL